MRFYVSFGVQYSYEEHPLPIAHPNGLVAIEAPSEDRAREMTYLLFAQRWSNLYEEGHVSAFDWAMYWPAGVLATYRHDDPEYLHIEATSPSGRPGRISHG